MITRHLHQLFLPNRHLLLRARSGTAVLATSLLLFGAGCGGCGEAQDPLDDPPAPPPMAVKDIQFGTGMVAVQNRIGKLTTVLREGPLAVYRFDPAAKPAGESKTTPVQFYDFHFFREGLVQVQITYDTSELRRSIGRDRFFRTIESRYQTQEDFNASDGRRWINTSQRLEVTWQEDFATDKGNLTVTWLPKKKALVRARSVLRQQREGSTESQGNQGGVDIGI